MSDKELEIVDEDEESSDELDVSPSSGLPEVDEDSIEETSSGTTDSDNPAGAAALPALRTAVPARVDPLSRYLSEIGAIEPLSREEEHDLAVRFKEKGDKKAGYKLVLSNLRLVVMIAREYQRSVQNILDLVQEGNIGLLEAVKQYDPYRGVRFPSYAVYWVRAYMLRYIINNIRLVKVGTTQAQRKLFFNLNKEKERLEAEGFVPEAKLLAERLNVKESEVLEMEQRLALPDLRLDRPAGSAESGEQFDLHGVFPDEGANVETDFVRQQFSESVRKAVEKFKLDLDEKEREIIDRRLLTDEPETLQNIADSFDLSRERIRQIEARLKKKLGEFLKEELEIDEIEEIYSS